MPQITANAFAWAYFRLAGGYRNAMLFAAIYLVATVSLIGLALAVSHGRTAEVASSACHVLLVVQGLVVGGFVCLSVANAIQKDLTSKMIESHRLMPVPPRLAVLGYIAGCAAPVVPIALSNLVLGALAANVAGLPVLWWFIANAVLLTSSAFLWCAAAAGALSGGVAGLAIVIPFLSTVFSGGYSGALLPGLVLFVSPMIGKTIFTAQDYDGVTVLPLFLATLVQGAMAAIFVAGASRRYRSSDLPAFPGLVGVLLVLCFAAASVLAVLVPEAMPRHVDHHPGPSQVFCSVMGVLVLGVIVLAATVADYLVERHRQQSPARRLWRELLTLLGVLGAILLICLLASQQGQDLLSCTLLTLLTSTIFLLTALLWTRWLYQVYISLLSLIVIIALQCLIPPVLAMFLRDENGALTSAGRLISQISVFASLPAIWDEQGIRVAPASLALQVILLAIPASLSLSLARRGSGRG